MTPNGVGRILPSKASICVRKKPLTAGLIQWCVCCALVLVLVAWFISYWRIGMVLIQGKLYVEANSGVLIISRPQPGWNRELIGNSLGHVSFTTFSSISMPQWGSRYIFLPLYLFSFACFAVLCTSTLFSRARLRAIRRGGCSTCGYLNRTNSPACSECGTQVAPVKWTYPRVVKLTWAIVAIFCIVSAFLAYKSR